MKRVDEEQAYIINSGKEMIWKIDMTEDTDTILSQVQTICADIEVFISYANNDREVAKVLEDVLVRKDYSVWTPEEKLKLGDLWEATLRCTYKGFYVILVSEASVRSEYIEKERAFATLQGTLIIPYIIGNSNITSELKTGLENAKEFPKIQKKRS